jgi:hypothetical protein
MVKRHQIYDINTHYKFCLFTSSLEYTAAYSKVIVLYTKHLQSTKRYIFRASTGLKKEWRVRRLGYVSDIVENIITLLSNIPQVRSYVTMSTT